VTVTALGLAVALAAGASWAGFDATRKALVARVEPTAAVAWVNLLQGPLFLGWAAASGALAVEAAYWPIGLGTLALQVLANLLLFRALAISPLGATIPFLSFTPVFASLVGLVVLSQMPSALQWVGIGVVVVGALLVHAGGERSLLASLREERGSLMVLGVAAIWSLTTALDKLALDHASVPLHAAVQSGGVGLAAALWLVLRGRTRALRLERHAAAPLLGALAFGTAALALQLWAIQLLLVGLVETIKRALGMTSAVVVGRLAFDEPVTRYKVAAIGLLAVGTGLIALG